MGGARVGHDTGLDTIEIFNSGAEGWLEKGTMINGRIGHRACVYEDKIYVFGGEFEEPSLNVLDLVEAYDPQEDSWKQRANLKHGLADFSVCVIDNKIFCLGGYILWGTPGVTKVQVYDPAVDSVYMATDFQYPRYGASAVAHNNKIYLISGCNSTPPDFGFFSPKVEIGVPEF